MEEDDPKQRTRRGVPTLGADQWLEAVLDLIASEGLAAVSIPRLATILGVTKGSFYWHFSSLDDLIVHAVERWESEDREALASIVAIEAPAKRLESLFERAMAADRAHALYLALSMSRHPAVARVIKRVSQRRMELLVSSFCDLGLPRAEAERQATLTYGAYIGGIHLRHAEPRWLKTKADLSSYIAHAAKVLIRRHPSG
jgi:AcrR family transcriptional regulator